MAKSVSGGGDVHIRLYMEAKSQDHNREELAMRLRAAEDADATFHPDVTATSKYRRRSPEKEAKKSPGLMTKAQRASFIRRGSETTNRLFTDARRKKLDLDSAVEREESLRRARQIRVRTTDSAVHNKVRRALNV